MLKFPSVRQIKTEEFAQWLKSTTNPNPLVVLDVRNREEYDVSHLEAARQVDPIETSIAGYLLIAKDTPIVVYCSIGYRSAKVAQQIQRQGFSRVFNLSGGIFQWANEQRPIFKDDHPAELVHPYNAIWGKLLK